MKKIYIFILLLHALLFTKNSMAQCPMFATKTTDGNCLLLSANSVSPPPLPFPPSFTYNGIIYNIDASSGTTNSKIYIKTGMNTSDCVPTPTQEDFEEILIMGDFSCEYSQGQLISGTLLPVTFNQLSCVRMPGQNGVQINWKNLTEKNISRYVIERSEDGVHYTKLDSITARNITQASYEWYDHTALSTKYFYRVVAIGTNGAYLISSILAIGVTDAVSQFKVSPNPVTSGRLNFMLTATKKEKYVLSLFNATGKLIINEDVNMQEGTNSHSIILPTAIAKGVYYLKLSKPYQSIPFYKTVIIE